MRRPSAAKASSSGVTRRRNSVAWAVDICAVLMVPVGSPVAVPSGMRSSGLRGGGGPDGAGGAVTCFAAGGCGPVFDAVDETVDDIIPGVTEEAAPGVTGKPVVALIPGGVSESGAGVTLCADGNIGTLRRVTGRRFALVETNPVVPAPEPGALG